MSKLQTGLEFRTVRVEQPGKESIARDCPQTFIAVYIIKIYAEVQTSK